MKKILVVSVKYIIYDVIIMEEVINFVDFKNAGKLYFVIKPFQNHENAIIDENTKCILSIHLDPMNIKEYKKIIETHELEKKIAIQKEKNYKNEKEKIEELIELTEKEIEKKK